MSEPVPKADVTSTLPDAPASTVAVMTVEDITINVIAGTPPKLTPVAPVKLLPIIVTVCPIPRLVGVKEETTGAGMYVKPPSVATPPSVVICTFPDAPAAPTRAVTCVGETVEKLIAGIPPKFTPVTPTKFVPLIVTVLPPP